ncbi:MAG: nitrilase-related carbon-nitrogen hydrolase, partial [Victivallaceae bacterium]
MDNLGFYRVAAAVPQVHAGDVDFNCREIIRLAEIAESEEAAAVVFPELSLSGATCGDIYAHDRLLNAVKAALCQVADAFAESKMIIVLGLPWLHNTKIFNAAAVIQSGKILGLSVKQHLSDSESRIFSGGALLPEAEEVEFFGYSTYIGGNMLFNGGRDFTFAVELGRDADSLVSPGRLAAGAGATAVFNLDSTPLLAGGDEKRCNKFSALSEQLESVYVVANAGVTESTTYNVHGGCSLIADCGRIDAVTAEVADLTARSQFGDGEILYADIDFEALNFRRRNRRVKDNANLDVVTFELECAPVSTV